MIADFTDEAEVQQFHTAARAAGGTDNGEPGLGPHYHQNYYGAFALDPDRAAELIAVGAEPLNDLIAALHQKALVAELGRQRAARN